MKLMIEYVLFLRMLRIAIFRKFENIDVVSSFLRNKVAKSHPYLCRRTNNTFSGNYVGCAGAFNAEIFRKLILLPY